MATGDSTRAAFDHSAVQEWAERVMEAFNAHDPDRFVAASGTEDVVLEHSGSPTTLRGRAEVRAFYAANWKAFPDAHVELEDGPFLHASAPRASVRWRVTGTNTGPIDPPGFAPTRKRFDVPSSSSPSSATASSAGA